MRLRRTQLLAPLVALGLAGCGTTVSGVAADNAAVVPGDGSGLTAPSAAPGSVAPDGTVVPGATGGSAYSPSGVTATTGTTGGSGGTGPTVTRTGPGGTGDLTTGPVGPGITDDTIYMAFGTDSGAAAGDRAIGVSGAAPSYNYGDVVNAVVDYANSHGGFAGRKLKLLLYDYDLTTPQDVQSQAACDYWTHDNKVFVIPADNDVLKVCAEKAGAVSLGVGGSVASTYKKYPHLIDPFSVRLDRLGPQTTNGLFKAGYFGGTLGFVTWDDPEFRYAYEHGYLPAMAAHGIKPKDQAFIKVPQTLDAVGEMSAAMGSVVTKFRSEGIDHVIIQDGHAGVWAGTGLTLEFMDQAESQKYYPRYGQNASNSPGWSALPSDQMDKAIAIMDTDFAPRFDAGWHTNKARELCFKIEADAGMPVQSSNENDEGRAAQACDYIFFTQQVINQLDALNSDAFIQVVNGLGREFHSAFVYGTEFAANQHDGSAAVRQAEYFASCKCLKYSGAPYYPE